MIALILSWYDLAIFSFFMICCFEGYDIYMKSMEILKCLLQSSIWTSHGKKQTFSLDVSSLPKQSETSPRKGPGFWRWTSTPPWCGCSGRCVSSWSTAWRCFRRVVMERDDDSTEKECGLKFFLLNINCFWLHLSRLKSIFRDQSNFLTLMGRTNRLAEQLHII